MHYCHVTGGGLIRFQISRPTGGPVATAFSYCYRLVICCCIKKSKISNSLLWFSPLSVQPCLGIYMWYVGHICNCGRLTPSWNQGNSVASSWSVLIAVCLCCLPLFYNVIVATWLSDLWTSLSFTFLTYLHDLHVYLYISHLFTHRLPTIICVM